MAEEEKLKIRMIEWQDGDSAFRAYLALNKKALSNLVANPADNALQGSELVDVLCAAGAICNGLVHYKNGKRQDLENGEAAVKGFDKRTGERTSLAHYQDGQLHDSASGAAAAQHFDAKTCNRTYLAHYQKGKWQDPENGEAAVQGFDANTGNRTSLAHYQADQLQDPENGEPAKQAFDPQTGALIGAERFSAGISQGRLTPQELQALAQQKGLIVPPLKHAPQP